MSRRNRKNNNGGSTKIDLGLEELLAAVNGNKSDPSDLSAEAAPKDSALEQPVEIENQVRNLYQDYFTKADWAELEKFCLRNLKDGFNLEAKLWWIRSVCQSGALPRFLLAAPFEEAVAFAKNNDSDSNLFSDLIAAISNELSGTIQSISSKVVSDSVIEEKVETSTLLRDPNIPIKSSDFDENAALLPVQANNRNHILRSRQVQLSVLVLAAILLSTAIYFLKMQSDQRKFRASLALLSQPKEVDSQESTDATVISSADKIDPNREPQEAVAAGSRTRSRTRRFFL